MCMRRNTKKGHIVIVSSLSAHVPLPGQTAYSATKAALRVSSPSTPAEYVSRQFRSQVVMPGQELIAGPQIYKSVPWFDLLLWTI